MQQRDIAQPYSNATQCTQVLTSRDASLVVGIERGGAPNVIV